MSRNSSTYFTLVMPLICCKCMYHILILCKTSTGSWHILFETYWKMPLFALRHWHVQFWWRWTNRSPCIWIGTIFSRTIKKASRNYCKQNGSGRIRWAFQKIWGLAQGTKKRPLLLISDLGQRKYQREAVVTFHQENEWQRFVMTLAAIKNIFHNVTLMPKYFKERNEILVTSLYPFFNSGRVKYFQYMVAYNIITKVFILLSSLFQIIHSHSNNFSSYSSTHYAKLFGWHCKISWLKVN